MNDEKEMLALILPEIENQGDVEYKLALKKREAELLEAAKKQAQQDALNAQQKGGVEMPDEKDDKKEGEAVVEKKSMLSNLFKERMKEGAK